MSCPQKKSLLQCHHFQLYFANLALVSCILPSFCLFIGLNSVQIMCICVNKYTHAYLKISQPKAFACVQLLVNCVKALSVPHTIEYAHLAL